MSTAVVLDLAGAKVAQAERPFVEGADPEQVEESLCALLYEAIAGDEDVAARLTGIGVAVPGVVQGSHIVTAPRKGWRDVKFGTRLSREFETPVILENDANSAALSEVYAGVGRARPNVIYVLLDAGIGTGIVIDGHLYRGRTGWAGEVGHITVPSQHSPTRGAKVEELAGLTGLGAALQMPNADAVVETLDLAHGAASESSGSVLHDWVEHLAWLLQTLGWALAPDLFVIGGRAAPALHAKDLARISELLSTNGLPSSVTMSTFGPDAIVMGAAFLPVRGFFTLPNRGHGDPGERGRSWLTVTTELSGPSESVMK